jgi:tetratricopeptide (TPR) repeat protein
MIHFAYPNIRSVKEFIGCGRFVVANDLPSNAYHIADPDSPNITEIRTVAENMVPDIISANRHIFEKCDNPSFQYRGDSLDLAYLLAYINTAWSLKEGNFAERNTDIWCTGAVDIKDRQYPWLKAMDSQQFTLKLNAFISQQNSDKLFIVPNANVSNFKKKLKSKRIPLLSIDEISSRKALIDGKIVIAIGPNDVPALVEYLFEIPDFATIIHKAKKINWRSLFNGKGPHIDRHQDSDSKELEEPIEQDISQVTLEQILTMLKLSKTGLREDLENAETYYARGYSYHQREEYKHAILDYDKAIEIDPNFAEAYQKRGICYRFTGYNEKAIADYDQAITLQRAWFHHACAVALYSDDKYDKALVEVNKSIQINPNYRKAYVTRGVLLRKKGDYENALVDYAKAIELDPNYKEAHNACGFCYRKLGEYEKAIAEDTKAIQIDPAYKTAYRMRGSSYRLLSRYEDALFNYNKSIELDPNCKKTYNARGYCYRQMGKYENAISDYFKAIQIDPAYKTAYINRGICYRLLGNYEAALADYFKTIELDPYNKVAYNNRGYCYLQKGDYENAIADYRKAIELDPAYILPLSNMAWFLATCPIEEYRNGTQAQDYIRRATKLITAEEPYPLSYYLYNSMAAAYAETGDFVKAVKTQKKAVALLDEAEDSEKHLHMAPYKEHLLSYQVHKPWREESDA